MKRIVTRLGEELCLCVALVFGLCSGVDAGYVNGNPLAYVDPEGLDAVVVTGGRREARNPFGHSAVGVTGAGIYSYGNNTPLGSSPLIYIESQSLLRNQLVTHIPLAREQDQTILDHLSRNGCWNCIGVFDNCAVRADSALRAGGVRTSLSPFPGGVARSAMQAPGATSYYIPKGGPLPPELVNALRTFNPPNVP